LTYGVVLTRAISVVAIAALEAETQDTVDHFEQVQVFLGLGHQAADQVVDLVAALAVIMKLRGETIGNPLHPVIPTFAPFRLHRSLV